MKRSSLFLSVIIWFSFVLVGCTDCNDDTSASVDESPVSFDEPPSPSSIFCGSANSASERSLWNADLSNQHNEHLNPVDEVPTPLDGDTPTLSSICDRDDLDSEYIVWNGDVTIDDLESLETYTLIKGDVDIQEQPSLEIIDLPELQIVCGHILIIENDNLQSLNLPQLKMVENIQINGHLALQRINLSKIQTVAGDLGISMNNILPDITLSQLKMVIGRMIVRSNYGLTMLNLPNLQTIGGEMSPTYEVRNSDKRTPVASKYQPPSIKDGRPSHSHCILQRWLDNDPSATITIR